MNQRKTVEAPTPFSASGAASACSQPRRLVSEKGKTTQFDLHAELFRPQGVSL
jgi:hypothetical protein